MVEDFVLVILARAVRDFISGREMLGSSLLELILQLCLGTRP